MNFAVLVSEANRPKGFTCCQTNHSQDQPIRRFIKGSGIFRAEGRSNMLELFDIGQSEGTKPGPKPGDGAVVYHNSGESDFDGLPGDILPPQRNIEKDPSLWPKELLIPYPW